MKFYKVETPEGPQLVGTLVDIPKDQRKNPVVEEVPTDKDGLLAYINPLLRVSSGSNCAMPTSASQALGVLSNGGGVGFQGEAPAEVVEFMEAEQSERKRTDWSAGAVLSRIDGPPNIDQLIEMIMKSKGHVLRRYAGAVALAFEGLK